MDAIKSALEYLAKEGRVILDAPITFAVLVIAIAYSLGKLFSFWHAREINALKADLGTRDSTIKLLEKQLEFLKAEVETVQVAEEAERREPTTQQSESVSSRGVRSVLELVLYAPKPVREAFLELTSTGVLRVKANPMQKELHWELPTPPTDEDITRIAIAKRLLERGLASGVTDEGLGSYSLIATSEARQLRSAFNDYLRKH